MQLKCKGRPFIFFVLHLFILHLLLSKAAYTWESMENQISFVWMAQQGNYTGDHGFQTSDHLITSRACWPAKSHCTPIIFRQLAGCVGVEVQSCVFRWCCCFFFLSVLCRSGDVTEPVAVQVGHAETLLPLLSLMNLFKEETPLTAANFAEQHSRIFLTSRMVPYAANLAFVLYSCREGPRLQLVLNERPLVFPGISDTVPLFRDVKEQYGELLSGCDFDKECELPPSNCSKCSELWPATCSRQYSYHSRLGLEIPNRIYGVTCFNAAAGDDDF